MKDFFELREAKASAQFTDHTPDKDFNDLAKKHKVKVTHDKNDEKTTIHGDEKSVLSVLKTMYGNDWKDMYTKKGSVYVDESTDLKEEKQFTITVAKGGPKGRDYVTKVSGKDQKSVVAKWRKENPKFKNDTVDVKQLATLKKKDGKYSFSTESVSLSEAVTVPRAEFDKLKKGDEITITYDSSIRKGTTNTFVVKGKSRSAKFDVDKIQMQLKGKPGGMKFWLYSRSGKDATLALGDMGATMTKFVKESVGESVEQIDEKMNTIDIARSVVKNKSAKHGLDMQTANLILKVYDKVNDKNKKKMETMAPAALGRAVWKMTGK